MSEEPIAVVGIGCLYPGAENRPAFSERVVAGEPRFRGVPLERYWKLSHAMGSVLENWQGSFFGDLEFDYRRFRIPPVYRRAVARMQLMLLQVADECLQDAGYEERDLNRDETDVYCGTCCGFDSTVTNALKVEARRLAHEWTGDVDGYGLSDRIRGQFGLSSHDKVGEMASSIPARIASLYSFRGRIQTMESADATGYCLLEAATMALRSGEAESVLIASGQRAESPVLPLALREKGVTGDPGGGPFRRSGQGVPFGEGATALLLRRLSDARRDGHRIYCVLKGLGAIQHPGNTGFRYPVEASRVREAVGIACGDAAVAPGQQQYIDCVVPGIAASDEAVLAGLAEAGASGCIGASVGLWGNSLANATLAAVAQTALSIHEGQLPPMPVAAGEALVPPEPLRYTEEAHWPEGACGGVCGSSLTGLNWHLVLGSAEQAEAGDRVQVQAPSREPIAIVGMGGAFGPANQRHAFRDLVMKSKDGIRTLPETLLPRAALFSEGRSAPLTTYADQGADLRGFEFNAAHYRIFPRRAAAMDRSQQLALSLAREAFEDYGLEERRHQLGRCAVMLGSTLAMNRERQLACKVHHEALRELLESEGDEEEPPPEFDAQTLDGCIASGSAAFISSSFQLGAIPVALEAACASSLAALTNAVQALRQKRYDTVLAGGLELPVNARDLVLCAAQMMLSQTRIAPFAEGADGFTPGDGGAIFVLKRLEDAVRDGDHIHAAITGVGASADAVSMTAPDAAGQALAMARAFRQARYAPASVQYLEAHGTGTRVGDRTEIESVKRVYGHESRDAPLNMGSVKSNIGHAFAGAGAAGLLKTLLAMNDRTLPPTLLRRALNPDLPLDEVPARIVTEKSPWKARKGRRRSGVSSFGTGGINYHLLLEKPDT